MSENTAENLTQEIVAKFDNKVDVKDVSFHFKRAAITDNDGNETGDYTKRPTVELKIPVPSVEGVIQILQNGGKGLELLLETIADAVTARARSIINDDDKISQETFPLEQLSWEAIANLPKAERRGGGINKETWEDFGKDYIAIMPQVTGKTVQQVTNASKMLVGKFAAVKTNKPVITKLKEQLGIYVTNSPAAETYSECVEFLMNKADALLIVDESKLLENL